MTPTMSTWCSNQLSYNPVCLLIGFLRGQQAYIIILLLKMQA